MTPERWQEVKNLLAAALERAPEERSSYLDKACSEPALRREVESLLAAHDQDDGSFIERIAVGTSEPLKPGDKIGPYEILARIGAGGMGEVYRAHDLKLKRDVAIKIIPVAFARDSDRLARFQREARMVAALNHANIAAIYGVEDSGSVPALVMELVEGETLAERLRSGPIPVEEAVPLARQIAEGLEAAHEHGIVHRDLKPANIKVTPEGTVKILDFGLAKALYPEGSAFDVPDLPTLTAKPTQTGVILGTAAYMSPEQARGKRVDKRTDMWAFGAVLYEMLTGRHAFEEQTVSDTLAAVLKSEPDWNALPPDVPAVIRKLLQRCLEKDPKLRLRDIGEARIVLSAPEQLRPETQPLPAVESKTRPRAPLRWWVATAVSIALALVAGWWLSRTPPSPPPWNLTRLTADPGLSDSPALSPDGKLVAYASDRGSDTGPDLYVKQVAGGQPIRLTSDSSGNTMPDFSPDGSKIVFRSERDGGGIYEIPAFGGDVRLLAREGLNPKYSPDGSQVAYWVGDKGVAAAVPGSGTIWVVPVAGGPPQQVGRNFTAARHPVWSPDGKRLIVIGYTSAKAYDASTIDWWSIPLSGGEAVKTGLYEEMDRLGLQVANLTVSSDFPGPACWLAASNTVPFSTRTAQPFNLWEIGISPRTGKVDGALRRLTAGAGDEVEPSCASGGALALTSRQSTTDIWSLAFDLDRGRARGVLERTTHGPANRGYPSLSSDGRYMAFSSDQSGQPNIWTRDVVSGKESVVSSSSLVQLYPVINPSGSRVVYSVFEKEKRVVYASAPGGAPEKLCEGCLRATDWSRDEKTVLVFGGDPYQISLLDLASHRQTSLLKHFNYPVLYGRFSPDNRWISFTVRTEPNRGYIAVAPIDGPKPVPEGAWIKIAPARAQDWANWSPDGNMLYFTSGEDGHSCLYGQRLDPRSRRPIGEPFVVQHLHGRLSYQQGGWSAAGGRIALVLVENTGNIWMMSRSGLH